MKIKRVNVSKTLRNSALPIKATGVCWLLRWSVSARHLRAATVRLHCTSVSRTHRAGNLVFSSGLLLVLVLFRSVHVLIELKLFYEAKHCVGSLTERK